LNIGRKGGGPFNWFAGWEHLSVEISDISVSIGHECVARKYGQDDKSISLRKFDEKSVPENIPGDKKEAYLKYVSDLFNETFTKPDSEETLVISGKFATEEHRSIGFIRSGGSYEGKPTTQRGSILISGSTRVGTGSLWSVSEDEIKWGWSGKAGEVCINLYIAPAQIAAAISEIKQAVLANRQIKVTATLYVLAFQSEVERSLAEPYHPQTYWFKDEAHASAVLERLKIWPISSQPGEPAPSSLGAPPAVVQPPTALPGYSTKALVIALWAIAVAIVFHALR
jgi:hypothetical protein